MTTQTYQTQAHQQHTYPSQSHQLGPASSINISQNERLLSVIGGIGFVAGGLLKRGWIGLAAIGLGAELLRRGITGVCFVNKLLGINRAVVSDTAPVSVPHDAGIRMERTITIGRPPAEVYAFWRDFSNLAAFMENVESIQVLDSLRSHWAVKGPAGMTVNWEAEIINEEPDRLIAWRSLAGADVDNAGTVRFAPAPGDRGTEVHVELEYAPVGGKAGAVVAKLFGKEPSQQVAGDLRRLKQLLETGQIMTVDGQPSGRA